VELGGDPGAGQRGSGSRRGGIMHSMSRWICPPVAVAIVGLAMWWVARNVEWGRFSFPHQAAVAALLVALGVGIAVAGLRSFAQARTTPNPMQPRNASTLVTSGVYRLSRNPMYVGDAIALAGVAVWLGSLPSLLLVAAFFLYIDRFQIAQE
jgi:protein-S-isoprenylcysteine O-methyltransferase Ste14